jgi:aminoglycoside phosphotransferase (APT) family kinase protein
MVLRCDPAASIVESTRRREFELMRYAKALMPVPEVHWIDDDGSEMGTPSLVSSFVEGVQKPAPYPSGYEARLVDKEGREYWFTGQSVALHPWACYSNSLAVFTTTRWNHRGREDFGLARKTGRSTY